MATLSIISLAVAMLCALAIAIDIVRGRRQPMAVMNAVWPITALYSGPIGLWAYFAIGRASPHAKHGEMKGAKEVTPRVSAVGATHCGAGCVLADIVGEVAQSRLGWSLFGRTIYATWALDMVLALAFGLVFQYFAIAPMRHLSVGKGIVAAAKADTLSLTAWQLGMYGFMAIVTFGIVGHELEKTDPRFWFAMQLAMIAGFLVAWPVNGMLIRHGVKEAM